MGCFQRRDFVRVADDWRSLRSFETEDIFHIPQPIKDLAIGIERKVFYEDSSFFMALARLVTLDMALTQDVLDLNNPLTSIDGRHWTFPASWNGPQPQRLAQTGLYYESLTGRVKCIFCKVRFRALNVPCKCPWEEHHRLMPECPQLVKHKYGGHHPVVEGKRPRSYSTSSACDMLQHEQKILSSRQNQ